MSAEVGLWRAGPLTDVATMAVAAAVVAGAVAGPAVPVPLGVAAVVVAVGVRRALLLAAAVGVLAAGLAHEARAGLAPPGSGPFSGTVLLVSDPVPAFGGWRADVRSASGRLELTARGGAGGRLSTRQAGERVEVDGRLGPVSDPAMAAPRHVRGVLVASRVVPKGATPLVGLVNRLRATVVDGARSLPEDQRALFTGFVLGDDRGASVAVEDDFDGAGLSHLLVVSGQNVVFVLVVAAPLLTRLRRRGRAVATGAILLLFAAVTRFEPSVLRATAMAGVAAVSVLVGRPVSGLRVLALAVAGLLLVDPLLVESVGFRLSVAASAGILLGARRLGAALPGPSWLGLPLAVTLSAQAAVAPLLVPTFGPMPVAAVPANLLAEPVAGLVMMWGCTAGVVAGLVPAPVAVVLHGPTRLGLWWVAGVARVGADAPLGRIGLVAILVVGLLLGLAVLVARRHRRRTSVALVVTALAVLALWPHLTVPSRNGAPVAIGGAELWSGPGDGAAHVLVVPGDARPDAVLAGLRADQVTRLDLVVLRSPGPQAAGVLAVIRERVAVDAVWAPPGSPAADAVEAPLGTTRGGGLVLEIRRDGDRLAVEVAVDDDPTGPDGDVGGSG